MTMMLTGLGEVPPEAVAAGCPNGWGDLPRNQLKVRSAKLDAFGLHVSIDGTRAGDLILRQFMSTSSTSRFGYVMLSRQVDAQAAVTSGAGPAGTVPETSLTVMVTGAPAPPLPFKPGPVATPVTQQVKVPSNTVFPGSALEFRAPTRPKLGLGGLGLGDAKYDAAMAAAAKASRQADAYEKQLTEVACRFGPKTHACTSGKATLASMRRRVEALEAQAAQDQMERERRDRRKAEAEADTQSAWEQAQASWAQPEQTPAPEVQDSVVAQLTLPGPKAYRVGDTGELLLPIEDLPVSADLILTGWCGQEIWRASKGVLRATKESSPEAKLEAERRAEAELAERQRLEQVALAAWNLAKAMADSARKEAERKELLAKAAKEPDEKLKLKAEAETAAGRAGEAEAEANLRKAEAEAQKKARDKAQKARDKAKKDVDVAQGGSGMSLGTKLAIGGGLLALAVVLLRRRG